MIVGAGFLVGQPVNVADDGSVTLLGVRIATIESLTNAYAKAVSDAVSATNSIVIIQGRTNAYEKAATDGVDATNRVTALEGGQTIILTNVVWDGGATTGNLTFVSGTLR